MSTALKKNRSSKNRAAFEALAIENVSRQPLQGRSKASLQRMLNVARELMLERGSEEFTLQEVSALGNVSIGSIYLRFESKENLVRTIIASALTQIENDENQMLEEVHAASRSLTDFIPRYVAAYADVLGQHAPLLRLAMQRASFDPQVSEAGKRSAFYSMAEGTKAMLVYGEEFGGKDREDRANAAYQIIHATLARTLSLGSTAEASYGSDLNMLKRELGRMCLAYLKADL